jgi:hypothetical protein
MTAVQLIDRGVIRVTGEDASSFLQGLLTCDIDTVTPACAGYGALLTPQGKIISDCLVVAVAGEDGGGFLLDAPLLQTPDLMKRLKLYRLRSKVTLDDLTADSTVIAAADGGALPDDAGLVYADPRLPALGDRAITDRATVAEIATTDTDGYHARRIGLGVPDGGKDFAYGDAFPHEALLDQLNGVSFKKGCYVGQEVVSRMQHRGTARTRIVPIVFTEGLVTEMGVEATAGAKTLGRVGSCAKGRGLAMLRLDRVADAIAAGERLDAGGLAFTVEKPAFARFPFPGEPGFGAAA